MATPENRLDIRNLLRRKLMAFPEVVTTLNGAITSSATSVTVTSGTNVISRMLAEIPSTSEIMRVTAGDGTNALTMLRGDQGTTAASALTLSTINFYPFWGWTDVELNTLINLAIDWLYPEVWYPKMYQVTVNASVNEFGLPSGVVYPSGERVSILEFQDDNSPALFQTVFNWKHVNDRIIISGTGTDKQRVCRITTHGRHNRFADDVTSMASSDPVNAIVLRATGLALENILANRTRYVEYSASLNDRASTADELQRQIYYFFNQAVIAKEQVSRPGMSGFASTRRA